MFEKTALYGNDSRKDYRLPLALCLMNDNVGQGISLHKTVTFYVDSPTINS